MSDFPLDVLRQVTLAGGVLDQDHLADADNPALAIAGGYLYPGIEIDDVLASRRRMPVDVVFGLGLTEDDTGGWQALGKLAASPLLHPLHFDVAEMRLAAGIRIQVVYAHRLSPLKNSAYSGRPWRLARQPDQACSRLTEPFVRYATDLWPVHVAQAQALQGASLFHELLPRHVSSDLDERVDRRGPHPCRCTQCAHRDQAGWNVLRDELVIERFWRAGCLIGPIAAVGEPPTGLDECRFAHAVDTIEPIGQG